MAIGSGLFVHHCVYLGGGICAHLTLDGIGVANIDAVVGSKSFWVIDHDNAYSPDVIVARAKSRLYDNTKYNLMFNNCEHFCEWCCTGGKWSHQVFGTMAVGWFFGPVGYVLGQIANHGGSQKYRLRR